MNVLFGLGVLRPRFLSTRPRIHQGDSNFVAAHSATGFD